MFLDQDTFPGRDMPDLPTLPDRVRTKPGYNSSLVHVPEPGYAPAGFAPRPGYAPGLGICSQAWIRCSRTRVRSRDGIHSGVGIRTIPDRIRTEPGYNSGLVLATGYCPDRVMLLVWDTLPGPDAVLPGQGMLLGRDPLPSWDTVHPDQGIRPDRYAPRPGYIRGSGYARSGEDPGPGTCPDQVMLPVWDTLPGWDKGLLDQGMCPNWV